ncbi:MAG: DNA-directed RNA polymerase subunit K [Candidatus Aenigmarchaeota archaeon]|nr:DNA-directed RNA polymerase subunit K [Candidatus Aenigmarchaeota archaeon]MDW8149497.1 DNA-directed RNA polymerase subunit K [Candidatus Aenigmarchaeota archaeon]
MEILTRYEVARIISARAMQISLGAPYFVKVQEFNASKIAKEEFKKKLIPMTVRRTLPNGEQIVVDIKKAIDNYLSVWGEI